MSSLSAVGVFLWQTLSQREALLERERDAISRMAQLVAAQTEDLFGRVRQFFMAADLWLQDNPRADPRFDPRFRRLVDDFRASVDGKIDIRLVSAEGGLFYIPSTSTKPLADVRDRGYYSAQLSPATRGFVVADPVLSRVTGTWGIPISYPLASRNAGIAVIFAALEEPMLEELYDAVRPKPRGTIALLRGNGAILARAPFDAGLMGKVMPGTVTGFTAALAGTLAEPAGENLVEGDGSKLVAAYSRLSHFDLVAAVTAREDDILAGWAASIPFRVLATALIVIVITGVSLRLLASLRELAAAREELDRGLARVSESDALKNRLFSIIAHDLRGPVGATAKLLEALAEDATSREPAELAALLATLRSSSAKTLELLENLLAWAKSQREQLSFSPRAQPLGSLVADCVAIVDASAGAKGIRVETDIEEGLDIVVDAEQFRIVLRNLLSNAVKFSRPGGKVRVSGRREKAEVRLAVEDEGVGMGRADIDRLFAAGERPSRVGTIGEGGSGIGLLLAKEIVDRHGGRIAVSSLAGRGSRFELSFPGTAG